MTPSPLVSVVMPVLNADRFIGEAIDSILAQTYDAWELLIVDDGSTDQSRDVARRHATPAGSRVRYLEHEGGEHRGASMSRNRGIEAAQGEFIAFLDADDVWLPEKLSRHVPLLAARPQAAMLYGNTRYWFSWTGQKEDEERDFAPDLGVPTDTVYSPPSLLVDFLTGKAALPVPAGVIVRRRVLASRGGFEAQFTGIVDDLVFYAKIAAVESIYVAAGCQELYRQHRDSSYMRVKGTRYLRDLRERYFDWLGQYLRREGVGDRAVWQALRCARWRNRHPSLAQLVGRGRRAFRRAMDLATARPAGSDGRSAPGVG